MGGRGLVKFLLAKTGNWKKNVGGVVIWICKMSINVCDRVSTCACLLV